MPLSTHPPGAKGKTFYADSSSHVFCIELLYVRHNSLLLLENEICTAQTVHNKTFPASHRMKNDGGKKPLYLLGLVEPVVIVVIFDH